MRQSSNKRGGSDISYSAQYQHHPDIGFVEHFHGTHFTPSVSEESSLQLENQQNSRVPSDMPHSHHESCDQNHLHETVARTHASQCQRQTWGGACCHTLTCLNSPFFPTTPDCPSKLLQSPSQTNSNQMSYKKPQTPGSAKVEGCPTSYTFSPAFALNEQSNMASHEANTPASSHFTATSQLPATPDLTSVSTPGSIFSFTDFSHNGRSSLRGWDTPASTLSDIFPGSMQNNNIPVRKTRTTDVQQYAIGGLDAFNPQSVSEHGNHDQLWSMERNIFDTQPSLSRDLVLQENNEHQTYYVPQTDYNDMFVPRHSQQRFSFQDNAEQGFVTNPNSHLDSTLGQQHFALESEALDTIKVEYNSNISSANTDNQFDIHPPLRNNSAYTAWNYEPQPQTITPSFRPFTPILLPSSSYAGQSNIGQYYVSGSGRGRGGDRNDEMDKKLVAWRDAGMSYKEIMAKGNFGLEESTLRGRYRTLTKSKDKRLRKPTWDEDAVKALLDGVEVFAPAGGIRYPQGKDSLDKVPWKKVAEWMERERGCYRYGNATVKKKYIDVIKARRLSRRQTMV